MTKKQLEDKIELIKEEINEWNRLHSSGGEACNRIYSILEMDNMEQLLTEVGFYDKLDKEGITKTKRSRKLWRETTQEGGLNE